MGGWLPGLNGRSPLRIGVVGAGFIGAVHAQAARRAGASIVGVAASTPSSTKEAVAVLGAERAFADGESLVTSSDIDVVHICTPNQLHAPLAELALGAGKHVICEKPLALDLPSATHLQSAAERAGVVATVPFVYRFYPLVREIRARVAAGFGPLRLIHGTYLQDWLSTEEDDNWRVDPAFAGPSRAFADIGSHWCDLVEFVTGDRLAAVCAELVTAAPGTSHERWPRPRLQLRHWARWNTPLGHDGGRRHRHVPNRRRSDGIRRHQPDLLRPQEPAVPRDHRRRGNHGLRPRAARDPLGRATSDVGARATGSGATWIRRPLPMRGSHPVTRRGTRTASTHSWPTAIAPSKRAPSTWSTDSRRSRTASEPRSITEAVLRSASSHRWEDVEPSSEPNSKEVRP